MKLTSHFQSPQMRSRYEDIGADAILEKMERKSWGSFC